MAGELQAAQLAGLLESRRHSKEATPEPPSEPEKLKLALELLVSADGLESIWVCGELESST